MASAGRILIMPKGNYNSSTTYEMLDLVNYNGKSWLAKKTSVGIEPSDTNSEYWQNMFDINAETVGALSKNGGTITGSLYIKGDWKGLELRASDGPKKSIYELAPDSGVSIYSYSDDANINKISVAYASEQLAKSVTFSHMVNGVNTHYNLIGEHNKELLRPYIEQVIGEYLKY